MIYAGDGYLLSPKGKLRQLGIAGRAAHHSRAERCAVELHCSQLRARTLSLQAIYGLTLPTAAGVAAQTDNGRAELQPACQPRAASSM